jgi:hypothetical protein
MEATSTAANTGERRHRKLAVTMIVIASLLAFLAVFSIWANRQLLETDNWVDTSTELLEDEAIRTELATFMVDTLYANVDVQAELEKRLPPDLKPLAGPAAGGIRQLTDDLANEALQRPRVQQAWETINRAAHEELITVVEDDTGEPVTLDVGDIVEQVGTEAGLSVAGTLRSDAGQSGVIPAGDLGGGRRVVYLVERRAVWLTALALLLFGLAIYLARGWRREALRGVGSAFIVVGIAVAAARGLAGNYVTDTLATTASIEPAISDTWEISTSLLSAGAGAMVIYGIAIVLGAWLAGPGGIATTVRRGITPVLETRAIGYSALLVVLLILFWWAPTEGFSRLTPSLLIIALFVIGFEFLRRQAVREFPDETWESASERWREGSRSLLDRRKGGD